MWRKREMYAAGIVFFTFVLLFIMFWIFVLPRERTTQEEERSVL